MQDLLHRIRGLLEDGASLEGSAAEQELHRYVEHFKTVCSFP